MSRLRGLLDRLEPHFAVGGRLQKYGALFEMIDTALYSPKDKTAGAPHIRDAADLKRVMFCVVIAAIPCILMAMWNTGYQANLAMLEMGVESADGWRGTLLDVTGIGYDPANVLGCALHGLLYFMPVYLVTLIVGGFWEVLFAMVRNHEVNEGFLVTSLLYALILPADLPLWQVAAGISFGVVVGKEVFGGTGKNLLNPALLGRAFLYFAYPQDISGESVWIAVDGYSGATALAIAADQGVAGMLAAGIDWTDAFLGNVPGSLGETSTLACLLGGVILIYTRVASWRIVLGVFLGMFVTASVFNLSADHANPLYAVPWYWHLALGGFAFGMVFMATDPVTAAQTDSGRWLYGLLIGGVTVLIRVVNPAYPEAIMMAILFANLLAPLIDQAVIGLHTRRRRRRVRN